MKSEGNIDRGTGRQKGPRFCPRCGGVSKANERLCDRCGDPLRDQGYCSVCERFWKLPAGALCPKHDLELDEAPLRPAVLDAGDPSTRWVTVGTFGDGLNAEAPRLRLEAEGIPTFLEGARMGSQSMYQVATGGVKLQVPQSLADDARVLLAQNWSPDVHADELDDAWDDLAPEPGAGRRSVMKVVILIILLGPLVLTLAAKILGN